MLDELEEDIPPGGAGPKIGAFARILFLCVSSPPESLLLAAAGPIAVFCGTCFSPAAVRTLMLIGNFMEIESLDDTGIP